MFEQNIEQSQYYNGLLQNVCKKHEYVTVTQTTTQTIMGKTEKIKETSWLQCKHCGHSMTVSKL